MDFIEILAIASIVLFAAVYVPFICIASLKLLRIRFTSEYQARLSNIAAICNLAILLHVLVAALSFLEYGGIVNFDFYYFGYFPYFLLAYSFWLRLWVYHFRIQYSYLTDNQEWKAIIDGNMQEEMKNDYYMVKKSTFGSWRWLIRHFWFLPFVGGVVLPCTLYISRENPDNVWMNIMGLISLILMVVLTLLPIVKVVHIIVWQFQEFQDVLLVLDEMSKLKWLAVISLSALVVTAAITLAMNVEDNLIVILSEHVVAAVLVVQLYYQSWWVVNRLVRTRGVSYNISYFTMSRKKSYSMTGSRDPEISYSTSSSYAPSSPGSKNKVDSYSNTPSDEDLAKQKKRELSERKIGTLQFLLSQDQTLDLFMKHLKSEFQDEILLSLIEFTQFRLLVNHNLNREHEKEAGNDGRSRVESNYGYQKLELSPNCPYSSILKDPVPDEILERFQDVDQSLKVLELKYRAHLMHKKYVYSGRADHEINISWQLRKKLDTAFKDLQLLMNDPKLSKVEDFKEIWSECCEEQYKYCSICVTRFKQTEGFRRILEHYVGTVNPE